MTTLRHAVHEYVHMRRALGYKLQEVDKELLDFVGFLKQQRASYITQALALVWAQQPSHAQPAYWARRLSVVRSFAHYRSATDPRTEIPARWSAWRMSDPMPDGLRNPQRGARLRRKTRRLVLQGRPWRR